MKLPHNAKKLSIMKKQEVKEIDNFHLYLTLVLLICQGGVFVSEQALSNEAKEARREYAKKWRAQNRDKVRESNRRYWERKAQQIQKDGSEGVKVHV